jgi:subtilisin family serine protease
MRWDPALWEVLDGPPGDVVTALVRFAPGADAPSGVRVVARFGDVATIRLRRGALPALRRNPLVASLKADRRIVPSPAVDEDPSGSAVRPGVPLPRRRSLGPGQPRGYGAVIGIVDWGCDCTHPNLRRDDGRTRLLALWDQRPARGRGRRSPYGYGVVHSAQDIDRALGTPDPFAALGYDLWDADEAGGEPGTHGTHVTDIAAGAPRAGPGGVAPGADLVFVHLAHPPSGPRGIGSSVSLLEAVHFIACTAAGRPWVINLSLGSQSGPHDGKMLVEQALDALVTSGDGQVVVQSCGNYGGRPIHAAGTLRAGERATIDWRVDPTDETANEIEIWYPRRDRLTVDLVAPDGTRLVHAPPDTHGPIVLRGRRVGRFAHRTHDPNNGDNHAALVLDPLGGGDWRIVLTASTAMSGDYHLWIERDDVHPGSQSRLSRAQAVYETTTSTISNGRFTIAVGAYDRRTGGPAWFSSRGPTRDGRCKPDVMADGVAVVAARSLPGDGGDGDPYLTCKSGTSMAAPQVAGAVALLYEAAGRPLSAEEVRAILTETARPVRGGSGACHGVLDVEAAVERARRRRLGPARQPLREDVLVASPFLDTSHFACPQPPEAAVPPAAPPAPPRLALADFTRPDDPEIDRAVDFRRALPKNRQWWTRLTLDTVRPLRDLDPAAQPRAFANRVIAFQRILRKSGADRAVLNAQVDVDGILGPRSLLALARIATGEEHAGLRTEVGALGFDLPALREPAGWQAVRTAEAAAYPPELLVQWTLRVDAERVLDMYALTHAEETDFAAVDHYIFGGEGTPLPNVTFADRVAILRALWRDRSLPGRASFVRVERSFVHELDHEAVHGKAQRGGRKDWWWSFTHRKDGKRIRGADSAAAKLGVSFEHGAKAKAALQTMGRQGRGAPTVALLLAFTPPEVSEADRLAAISVWKAAKVEADRANARTAASNIADILRRRKEKQKGFYLIWDRELEVELIPFKYAAPIHFEYALDALKQAGWLGDLFTAFGAIENYDRRELLAEITLRTRYKDDPVVVGFRSAHRKNTESMRKHGYDAGARQIRLGKSDRVLYTKDVDESRSIADEVQPGYRTDWTQARIKPARMEALCRDTMVEIGRRLDTIIANRGPDAEKAGVDVAVLAREAVEAVLQKTPLAEADVEQAEYKISVRFYDIRAVKKGGLDRFEIQYARCEKFGSEPWRDIEEPQWRSEVVFDEELAFFRASEMMDALAFIGQVIGGIVVLGAIWASGAGSALVALAGGGKVVLASIAISEIFHLITSVIRGKPITLEGILGAALDGYLAAVGFKLFAPVGAWVAAKVTPNLLQNRVRAWLISKLVLGTGAGGFSSVGSRFANDMVHVVRDGGGFSSWDRYLKDLGMGAALGAVFEIGGGTVLAGAFGAARGTVLDKAVEAATRTAEHVVAYLRKKGIGATTWTAEATTSLSVFRQRMESVMRDPAKSAATTAAAAQRITDVTSAWQKVRAAGGRFATGVSAAIHTHALELAKVNLSRGSAEGLRRLLARGGPAADQGIDDFLTGLIAKPDRADDVLRLLGAVDADTFARLATKDGLAGLLGADDVLALVRKTSVADVAFTLTHDFRGDLARLGDWARRFERLPPPRQAEVLEVLRTHGASFRPSAVLALAEGGVAFTPSLRVGVERLTAFAGVDPVNALLALRPPRADALARVAATAPDTDRLVYKAIVEDAERAARLLSAADEVHHLLIWTHAAKGKVSLVDELLQLVRRPAAGGATALDAVQAAGLEKILRVASRQPDGPAAARRLLSDAAGTRSSLQQAGGATDEVVADALRHGRFGPRGQGKPKLAPDPRPALDMGRLAAIQRKLETDLPRLRGKIDDAALRKLASLGADTIREAQIHLDDLAKLAVKLSHAGPETRRFMSAFHDTPGFEQVVLNWAKSRVYVFDRRARAWVWQETPAMRNGTSFMMRYCNAKLTGVKVRFEWPAGIKDTSWGGEVWARYVDIVIEGGSGVKPGGQVYAELKSWTEATLARKAASPQGLQYQLTRDTALFGPDNIRWVFDRRKGVSKAGVIGFFKKVIKSDPYLTAKWGKDDKAIEDALSRVIDVF